jgi:hypothetical protein
MVEEPMRQLRAYYCIIDHHPMEHFERWSNKSTRIVQGIRLVGVLKRMSRELLHL